MLIDPNTHWWSVVGLRLATGVAAGVAFIGTLGFAAEAATAQVPDTGTATSQDSRTRH